MTPVILINLNLPPDERYRIENILASVLIPGPSEPKDLNSFLRPLVDELHLLDGGVQGAVDGEYPPDDERRTFTLHAWVTIITGKFQLQSIFSCA